MPLFLNKTLLTCYYTRRDRLIYWSIWVFICKTFSSQNTKATFYLLNSLTLTSFGSTWHKEHSKLKLFLFKYKHCTFDTSEVTGKVWLADSQIQVDRRTDGRTSNTNVPYCWERKNFYWTGRKQQLIFFFFVKLFYRSKIT